MFISQNKYTVIDTYIFYFHVQYMNSVTRTKAQISHIANSLRGTSEQKIASISTIFIVFTTHSYRLSGRFLVFLRFMPLSFTVPCRIREFFDIIIAFLTLLICHEAFVWSCYFQFFFCSIKEGHFPSSFALGCYALQWSQL